MASTKLLLLNIFLPVDIQKTGVINTSFLSKNSNSGQLRLKAYSEPNQTSTMDFFAKIVNS